MRHDEELAIAGVVGVEDLRLRARRHVEELDALLGHGALARAEDGVDHLQHGTAGRGTATTVVEEHGVEEHGGDARAGGGGGVVSPGF